MQNKYVGDVGDFGKYALLSALCAEGKTGQELKLGVVWYLVADGGIEYLQSSRKNDARFRDCDEVLYDKLASIVRGDVRTVTAIEHAAVLPRNTVFFNEVIKSGTQRRDWVERALEQTKSCALVFLDPNTGLKDPPERSDGARGREYAYADEVLRFASHGGDRSVVIYHHPSHTKHDTQIAGWLDQLRQRLPSSSPFALRFRPYSPRAFLVVPARAHTQLIDTARAFVKGAWEPHFELIERK